MKKSVNNKGFAPIVVVIIIVLVLIIIMCCCCGSCLGSSSGTSNNISANDTPNNSNDSAEQTEESSIEDSSLSEKREEEFDNNTIVEDKQEDSNVVIQSDNISSFEDSAVNDSNNDKNSTVVNPQEETISENEEEYEIYDLYKSGDDKIKEFYNLIKTKNNMSAKQIIAIAEHNGLIVHSFQSDELTYLYIVQISYVEGTKYSEYSRWYKYDVYHIDMQYSSKDPSYFCELRSGERKTIETYYYGYPEQS